MRKMIRMTIQKIRKVEQQRAQLLEGLLTDEPLLKGSLALVKRRCGKANCHCVKKPTHEVWVLGSSQGGKPRCQVIRKADVAEARERQATYKEFRAALRELEAMRKEENALLRSLMEDRHVPYE
jgi:hypothetical protein